MHDLVMKNAAMNTAQAPAVIPINRFGRVDHNRTALQFPLKIR